jgi:hypothetical protein
MVNVQNHALIPHLVSDTNEIIKYQTINAPKLQLSYFGYLICVGDQGQNVGQ